MCSLCSNCYLQHRARSTQIQPSPFASLPSASCSSSSSALPSIICFSIFFPFPQYLARARPVVTKNENSFTHNFSFSLNAAYHHHHPTPIIFTLQTGFHYGACVCVAPFYVCSTILHPLRSAARLHHCVMTIFLPIRQSSSQPRIILLRKVGGRGEGEWFFFSFPVPNRAFPISHTSRISVCAGMCLFSFFQCRSVYTLVTFRFLGVVNHRTHTHTHTHRYLHSFAQYVFTVCMRVCVFNLISPQIKVNTS